MNEAAPGGQDQPDRPLRSPASESREADHGPLKSRRLQIWILGGLLLIGLGLRVYALGRQSVWIDEAYSLDLAGKSFQAIVAETARDNHPPAYYLLLAAWTRLGGTSEAWARLLSAILGALLITVFHRFSRQVLDPTTALLATALLTLSPFALWHSQDARMYALLLLATYVALAGFLGHLRGGSPWLLGLWVAALMIALYTHLYALFVIPVLIVHLFQSRREVEPRRLRRTVVGLAVALLALLPWAWIVATSALHEAGFYKRIGWLTVPYVFYAFSVGYSFGPSVNDLHKTWQSPDLLASLGAGVVLAGVLFGTVFILGVVRGRKLFGRNLAFAGMVLAFPILLPILVTSLTRIDFNARYAIIAFPVFLSFVAAGLRSLPSPLLRSIVGGGLATLLVLSVVNYFGDERYAKEDSRGAFERIESRFGSDDCLLVIGVHPAFRYYAGVSLPMKWLDFRSGSRVAENRGLLVRWRTECRRLWFVSGREWESDPLGLARASLEEYFTPVSESDLTGVRILEMKPSTP